MRFSSVVLLSLGLTSCVSPFTREVFSKTQFGLTSLFGRRIICASAERTPCGLRLSDCSDGLIIECAIDVIVLDVSVKQEIPPPPAEPEGI